VATPMSKGRTVDVIVSPSAQRKSLDGAIIEAARRGEVGVERHCPESLDDLHVLLADLVTSNAERVVVAGGDGIVHQAFQHLAGTQCVLGIVPAGTGNDFASAIGLPADPVTAMTVALGPARRVDAIRVGDRWAASVLTFGFSVAVNERAERMRFPRGPSKYTIATLAELPRMAAEPVEITVDGTLHQLEASLVAVANTPMFGGGMKIAPGASPSDGLLDVVVVEDVGRLRLARLLSTAFDGSHVEHSEVIQFRGVEVGIGLRNNSGSGSLNAAVRADGEEFGTLPVVAVAEPSAISVAGAS